LDYAKQRLIDELSELPQRRAELRIPEVERKHLESILQTSSQPWQTAFNAMSDAVSLIDLEGRIVYCNAAMVNLLGKRSSEINARTCWELVHGSPAPIDGCPIVRMLETRHRETLVLPLGHQWIEVTVDPLLNDNGNLMGAVHVMSDITESRQTEEETRF